MNVCRRSCRQRCAPPPDRARPGVWRTLRTDFGHGGCPLRYPNPAATTRTFQSERRLLRYRHVGDPMADNEDSEFRKVQHCHYQNVARADEATALASEMHDMHSYFSLSLIQMMRADIGANGAISGRHARRGTFLACLQRTLGACPLLAQSRHKLLRCTCPVSGVKQTPHMSVFDPKRTF